MTRWAAGPLVPAALLAAALTAVIVALAGSGHGASPPVQNHSIAAPAHRFGPTALGFEPSAGRFRADTDFVARGHGSRVFVGAGVSRMVLFGTKPGTLTSRLVGARTDITARTADRQGGRVNWFVGSRARWRRGLRTYGRVTYPSVYPGVDLVYHGREGRLEYDFVVAPGADPRRVRLALSGARSLRLAANGDLLARVGSGTVRQQRPVAYQEIGGTRHRVAARFVLDRSRLRFTVGHYDRARALVIDPTLLFGDYIASSGDDSGVKVALDSSGNIFIVGSTTSTSIPGVSGTRTHAAGSDAYVLKLSPSGARQWITYLGGSQTDTGNDIAIDGSGRPHITGWTLSDNYPTPPDADVDLDHAFGGGFNSGIADGVLTTLNSGNGSIAWSTYLPDTATAGFDTSEAGLALAVDPQGNSYPVGATVTFQENPLLQTAEDGNVWKYDPDGKKLYGPTTLASISDGPHGNYGNSVADEIQAIAITDGGCVISPGVEENCLYVAGQTKARGTTGNTQHGFVWKAADSAGYWFTDCTAPAANITAGCGNGGESVGGIAVDSQGNPTITGTRTIAAGTTWRGFITRFNGANGAEDNNPYFQFDDANADGYDIAYDAQDNIYIGGDTYVTSADATGAIQPNSRGAPDGFVVKWNPRYYPGEATQIPIIAFQTFIGGQSNDLVAGIAVDGGGRTVLVGSTSSSNVPTQGSTQSESTGFDAFVEVIRTNSATIDAPSPAAGSAQQSRSATFKYSAKAQPGFDWTADEGDPTFTCQLAGRDADYATCDNTGKTYSSLTDGSYTFRVKAFDAGGTTNGTVTTRQFFVDNVAPDDFALLGPGDGDKTGSRPGFSWQEAGDATSGVASYRVVVDGTALGAASCCAFTPQIDLAQGAHSWKVVAVDKAGNERESATRAFTVSQPINAKLVISPNPALVGRNVTFDGTGSGDANHAISNYQWDLDGDGKFERDTGGSGVTNATYPKAGTFKVGLQVKDVAGLVGTATVDLHVNDLPGTQGQFGVTIEKGATYTNSPNVTVSSKFPPTTTSMLFSNDGGFLDPTTFEPQLQTKWKLVSTGPERLPKTIYVRFLAGFVTNQTYQDDIILDERPPVVDQAAVAPAGAAPAAARAAALRGWKVKLKAHDTNSGVGRVQVTSNKKKPGKLLKYKRKLTVKSAKRPKWVRARDRAGNFSKWKKAR